MLLNSSIAGLENVLIASGELDPRNPQTELRLPGGKVLRIDTAFLLQQTAEELPVFAGSGPVAPETVLIPIVEERLEVGKRTVVSGKVLLEKHVHAYDERLDVPLAVRTFDVERVVLNQPVDKSPEVRVDGETTIYPIVEEQLVLTTQLILKEELRVTQRDTERRDTRTVTLKRESITVTRTAAGE